MKNKKPTNASLVGNKMAYDRAIDVYSEDNEFSVFNMLPSNSTFLRSKFPTVPEDLREADQYTIRNKIKPTPTLNQLRLNFWAEYDRCIASGTKININNVIVGVCSLRLFKLFCSDPEKLAWVLTPVQSYEAQSQDLIETALYKMRCAIENLDMTDVKQLNTVMKIYEAFDKRMHGDYTQKIQKHEVKEVNYTGASSEIKKTIKDLGVVNDNVVIYDKGDKND